VSTSLGEKLRRWNVSPRPAAARPRAARGIEAVVPGQFQATAHGECFVVERRYPLDWRQGATPLAAALELSPRVRSLLTRGVLPDQIDLRRALFLDTETTGLSTGTGTYAFLVGVGFLDGDVFVLRQFFMRHPGEELALLAAVEELLANYPLWVTFNGKAFDAPLLETRFRYHHRRHGPTPGLHLDLLHPARRLWRHHLPSCALSSLERSLLGVRRVEDVPSYEIPALYFDYVRRARCEPLRAVFAHNADDLLSLMALLGLLGQVLDAPERHAPTIDALAVLRLYVEAGYGESAVGWCRAALPALGDEQRGALRWELAKLLRRRGDRQGAEAIWRELAAERGPWCLAAQVELAKQLEHGERDYRAATRLVEAALASLIVSQGPTAAVERAALERRLGRLHYRSRRDRAPGVH
jgi:uncharacterized protein YprB with RNaseH-like and TPR domain